MAILESVKKLASKVGADTNGRTIAEQINNINRHLDSTGSRDIAEAVSKFADKEDGTAILITKTVTENKTYKASDDGASGYSSVTVNVPSSGGETFEVVFSSSDFVEWTANKSYAETLSAIENGDNVKFKFNINGTAFDSSGYYLFAEDSHPENAKIIMVAVNSGYESSLMVTSFIKWTSSDVITVTGLTEVS